MSIFDPTPLFFWQCDMVDLYPTLFSRMSLNQKYGKFAANPKSYSDNDFSRFNLPHSKADTVLVHDHLNDQKFMQQRRVIIPEPAGTYVRPPDNWPRQYHDTPDDSFHRCDKCNEAVANAHPMDVPRLCNGCEHNAAVIERLNKLVDEYF